MGFKIIVGNRYGTAQGNASMTLKMDSQQFYHKGMYARRKFSDEFLHRLPNVKHLIFFTYD